ncbi:MAG TPA: adenosylcobalamin-dependent ribonucleoside-diphosphate reductase [Pseudomonadales bacterium]
MNRYRFETDIARHIWETKYRYAEGDDVVDTTIENTWARIAHGLAAVEHHDHAGWRRQFRDALTDFRFLPGGRIQAGAGTNRRVTLFNCFVMGRIEDSMEAIFDALKEAALTMQAGGGVGYDFSTLRPRRTQAHDTGNVASGPVSFMRVWDAMCATVLSTGARRGAMMATLRCDHPDIEAFIAAKQDPRELRHFNCSVLVTDEFMEAVDRDEEWPLVFPAAQLGEGAGGETVLRAWPGSSGPVPCRVVRKVRAVELWRQIMRATYDYAEPGVLFIDRINRHNNLHYCEEISATNPCGEIPLPPYGACDLGAINLTRFVSHPFEGRAELDLDGIAALVPIAVRMLDNVIDASRFPVPAQAEQARRSRRIGLGVTGLANVLAMLNLHYGSDEARELAARIMRTIRDVAYRTSVQLAREKGPFPLFEARSFLAAPGTAGLPDELRESIARHGIRNSHLTAIAPTGTISLLAENVSSGIEPAYQMRYTRRVLALDGTWREFTLEDYAHRLWRRSHGDAPRPSWLVTAGELSPREHLLMQAALQPYVDHAISKTINVPEDLPFEAFEDIYREAYRLGLKGCTTFRPNPITGSVLASAGSEGTLRCSIERECD